MLKRSALALLLSSYSTVAFADTPPSVSFAPFPLPVKQIRVDAVSGTPASKAELNTPFPNDFPPSSVVSFDRPGNCVRVYNITEVKTAPYQTIRAHIENTRNLLANRPEQPPNRPLPDYPPVNAGHVMDTKLSYLDAAWGSGVFYVTQFSQENESPSNEELVYLFQGLSKGEKYYVSADFSISHPKVPQKRGDRPNNKETIDAFTGRIAKLLNQEADSSFRPSLRRIRDWIATLEIHRD